MDNHYQETEILLEDKQNEETEKIRETEKIKEITKYIKIELENTDKRWTNWYIRRFLVSENSEIPKTKEKIKNFINFQNEIKMEDLGNFEKRKELENLFELNFSKIDKFGNPILIHKLKNMNFENLLKTFSEENLINFYLQKIERLVNIILPECSKKKNEKVEKLKIIIDLKKTQIFNIYKKIKNFLEKLIKILINYYPEILDKLYIINSGYFFKAIWQNFENIFGNENFENKIFIFSGNGKKKLIEEIDEENLKILLKEKEVEVEEKDDNEADQDFVNFWDDAIEKSYKDKNLWHHDKDIIDKFY